MVNKVADLNTTSRVTRNESSHNVEFAKGGKTKMFGEQNASPQTPGETYKDSTSGKGAEFAKGGSGKMFGFSGSEPARAGITSAR